MQNHTVVQFPLESYRAIKKQFEVKIDVPWGLLPGMRCLSEPPGHLLHCSRGGHALQPSPAVPVGATLEHSQAMAPRWLCQRQMQPETSNCTEMQPPPCPRKSASHSDGTLLSLLWVFLLFYPPDAVPQCDFLDVKYQGMKFPSAIDGQWQ